MFSENLKRLRKSCGFKQEDVAKVLGIDRSAYSYYEGGKTQPSITNLIKIAHMFKVDVDELIGNDKAGQQLEFGSEQGAGYRHDTQPAVRTLGECSAEERVLVAWFRQIENKEKILELLKEEYDRQQNKEEE